MALTRACAREREEDDEAAAVGFYLDGHDLTKSGGLDRDLMALEVVRTAHSLATARCPFNGGDHRGTAQVANGPIYAGRPIEIQG